MAAVLCPVHENGVCRNVLTRNCRNVFLYVKSTWKNTPKQQQNADRSSPSCDKHTSLMDRCTGRAAALCLTGVCCFTMVTDKVNPDGTQPSEEGPEWRNHFMNGEARGCNGFHECSHCGKGGGTRPVLPTLRLLSYRIVAHETRRPAFLHPLFT